eukprot:13232-Heterococcus_DN1.PRE.7
MPHCERLEKLLNGPKFDLPLGAPLFPGLLHCCAHVAVAAVVLAAASLKRPAEQQQRSVTSGSIGHTQHASRGSYCEFHCTVAVQHAALTEL